MMITRAEKARRKERREMEKDTRRQARRAARAEAKAGRRGAWLEEVESRIASHSGYVSEASAGNPSERSRSMDFKFRRNLNEEVEPSEQIQRSRSPQGGAPQRRSQSVSAYQQAPWRPAGDPNGKAWGKYIGYSI